MIKLLTKNINPFISVVFLAEIQFKDQYCGLFVGGIYRFIVNVDANLRLGKLFWSSHNISLEYIFNLLPSVVVFAYFML